MYKYQPSAINHYFCGFSEYDLLHPEDEESKLITGTIFILNFQLSQGNIIRTRVITEKATQSGTYIYIAIE